MFMMSPQAIGSAEPAKMGSIDQGSGVVQHRGRKGKTENLWFFSGKMASSRAEGGEGEKEEEEG